VAFPWDNLIAAGAGLIGGLGGGLGSVALRARYDRSDAQQARQDSHVDAQRNLYARLVVTARLAARNLRVLYSAEPGTHGDDLVLNVFQRTDILADELNQAVALVQLLGSEQARTQAELVITKAQDIGAVYQARSHLIMSLPAGERARRLEKFDSAAMDDRIDELHAAINDFIAAVRPEFTPPAS
jgi:hypothetical protein